MTKNERRAQIVGTGLIGGSIALALRARGWHITGRDIDAKRAERALELGVLTASISDAGRTEVEPGTFTCMAIGPNYEHIIDRITGHLKLYS